MRALLVSESGIGIPPVVTDRGRSSLGLAGDEIGAASPDPAYKRTCVDAAARLRLTISATVFLLSPSSRPISR